MKKPVDFYEIYDYYYQPVWERSSFKLTFISFVAILIGVIIFFIIKYFLRKRREKSLLPWEWALKELNRLELEKCSNKKEYKIFYFDLTDIIKKYLNKRYFYFQNTGSQIISLIATEFSDKYAFDCCAAPGTKSITLNQVRPDLNIFANDINFKRMAIMNKSLRENTLEKIQTFVSDITKPAIKNRFDFIILDAPCTSSGTLRKNPDLKIKINDKYIKRNATKQNEIVKAIVNNFSNTYVLYSVCSFIKEETEDIMKNISKNKKTEIIDISEILSFYDFIYKKGNSGFYLLPNPIINNDIFYLSLFKIKP